MNSRQQMIQVVDELVVNIRDPSDHCTQLSSSVIEFMTVCYVRPIYLCRFVGRIIRSTVKARLSQRPTIREQNIQTCVGETIKYDVITIRSISCARPTSFLCFYFRRTEPWPRPQIEMRNSSLQRITQLKSRQEQSYTILMREFIIHVPYATTRTEHTLNAGAFVIKKSCRSKM